MADTLAFHRYKTLRMSPLLKTEFVAVVDSHEKSFTKLWTNSVEPLATIDLLKSKRLLEHLADEGQLVYNGTNTLGK